MDTLEGALGFTTVGLAALAGFQALAKYRAAQRWRRAEFLAGEVKELLARPRVEAALRLLDWENVLLDSLTAATALGVEGVRVNSAVVARALLPHEDREPFTRVEQFLRDCFDELLDGFERLAHYGASGLIEDQDVKPYLGYWLERIATHHDPAARIALKRFITRYHPSARALFAQLGVPLGAAGPTKN